MIACWIQVGLLLLCWVETSISSSWSRHSTTFLPKFRASKSRFSPLLQIRGGDTDVDRSSSVADQDEERYSRQVYTLGARAHGLIRSSTVYLDGPARSGLLWECAKNLALSGIRQLVFVISTDDDDCDANYHNPNLDDLGAAYIRATRAEMGSSVIDNDHETPDQELLVEYIRRLNPSVLVSCVDRSAIKPSQDAARSVLVCVDRPFSTQVSLNRQSRNLDMAFLSVETAGVFGRAFCDFGDSFEVYDFDGETPLVTPLHRIEEQEDGTLVVHSMEGEKHDVSKGDVVEFQLRNGTVMDETCVVEDVQTPFRFVVRLESEDDVSAWVSRANRDAASVRRVKIPQEVSFQPMEVAVETAKTDGSLFTPCDLDKSFDHVRRSTSFSCFQALSAFVEEEGRLPTEDDLDEFWELTQSSWVNEGASDATSDEGECHCRNFLRSCAAKFTPFQAVFGAIAAQEALKAASGLYNPIRQFLLYDCDEVLLSVDSSEATTSSSHAPGLAYILGSSAVKALRAKRIFVVGAGAIGCEILKNLAAMSVGTSKKGRIVLTDMDTIEKSNLSRQLLFRDSDIGKFKSNAAHDAALRFNRNLKMEVHSSKVGEAIQGAFDEDFWAKKVDIVLNALDNVDARLYMDGQCVANEKALVDAGTMGPKGNVQVVVPHQTESYASSVDPPEAEIPLCTLKNFPYAIAHTIQWGRDLFDGLFERRPQQANDFANSLAATSVDELSSNLVRDRGDESALQAAEELNEDLITASMVTEANVQELREHCLSWAVQLARKLFRESAEDLLRQHPLGSVDDEGEPFWSGSRLPPKALTFSSSPADTEEATINENLIEFVRAAARLRIETYSVNTQDSGQSLVTREKAMAALGTNSDHGACEPRHVDSGAETVPAQIQSLLEGVPLEVSTLNVVEFEKDDDANGHVIFVTAASNLRAICYGIPPVDAMETRRVAGNIVPAMITTTAFVSALSCIELIKLVQGAPLQSYRNAFINLALPFFAFTIPLPAEQIQGLRGRHYTLWDRLSVKEGKKAAASGGLTMRSLLKRIKKQACVKADLVEVTSISFGPYMLFANFLHEDDESILGAPLWEVISDAIASSEAFDEDFSRGGQEEEVVDYTDERSFVDLTVAVEDVETSNEVELPPVRVLRYKAPTKATDS